jgi:CDGSH-type Zn-finger protein
MAEPEIAKTTPYGMKLEPGRYWWCACGKSRKQPFCDGSHKGSEFTPLQVQIDEAKKVFLCGCKRSANSPFCDGSHNKL